MKMHGLPSYIYRDGHRCYLTFSKDVYGNWNAGYYAWLRERRYGIVLPTVQNYKTIEGAARALSRKLEEAKSEH